MTKRAAKTSANDYQRAALYARVSTAGQVDNTSLDAQLRRAGIFAEERGYAVVARKREDIGGTFVLARSEFNDLLEMAADGLIDVIVCDIPDRLGRGDAIAQLELLTKMNGARIEYAQAGRDTSTVEGLALKATDQLVSGIERQNIRRRTMEGKRDWARRGRVIANPHRPYGYRYASTYDQLGRKQSCELEVVEDEAPHALAIYEWLVYEGLTLNGIARRLHAVGILTMTGKPGWARQTIHNILTNSVYKGAWSYGKKITCNVDTLEGVKSKVTGKRSGDDLVTVACPAIVPAALWAAAQVQLAENQKKFRKPTVREYLLRGRVRCARCQGSMVAYTTTGGYTFYRCWRRAAVELQSSRAACPTKQLSGRLAEGLAWDTVLEALEHPERLLAGAAEQREEAARARRLIEQSLAALGVQAEKDAAGLQRVFEMVRDGDAPKNKYREEKARVEKREEEREKERADLRARLAETTVLSEDDEAYILDFARQVANRLHPDVPFTEKARLVDLLRVECIFDDRTGDYVVSGLMGARTLSTKSRTDSSPVSRNRARACRGCAASATPG
jgi:site-specific DNA recombinase